MKKLAKEGIILIVLLASIWAVFTLIPWEPAQKVGQISKKMEERLGESVWEYFNTSNDVMPRSNKIYKQIDSLLVRICEANEIDRSHIKLHIVYNNEINAYALPDGHLVILTGLISFCDNPEQLAGVMAHELAHIQKGHVMQKLVKEIGVSLLISAATGEAGGEVLRRTGRTLSSTAFDRGLEREADELAVQYLMNAKISPTHMADFFDELASSEPTIFKYLTWMRTHPDTQERADKIRDILDTKQIESIEIMDVDTWDFIKYSVTDAHPNPWNNVED